MTPRYDYRRVSPRSIAREVQQAISEADVLIDDVVRSTEPRSFESTLLVLAEAGRRLDVVDGRASVLRMVHPDRAIRQAAISASERTDAWRRAIFERGDVAAAVESYAETRDARELPADRRWVLDAWRHELRRAGAHLDLATRTAAAELRTQIADLTRMFVQHLVDFDDSVVLRPDDLVGLGDGFVAQLEPGPQPGSRRLPITGSAVAPLMAASPVRALRETVLRRFLNRAADTNRETLDELLAARRKLAKLLGYASWSDYANEARMSGNAQAVTAFLDGLAEPLGGIAGRERAQMRDMLRAAGEGVPDGDPLEAWDWFRAQELARRALGVDTAALTDYLPLDQVLQGLFDLCGDVFGIDVVDGGPANAWHDDVRLVLLRDRTTGEHMADVYLDLFYREGKGQTAWVQELRPPVNRGGGPREPAAVLFLGNYPKPASGSPALLPLTMVEQVFHEFGHVLDFGIQRAETTPFLRTWIETDFVEAPSQIMEHWAWHPDVIRRIARHHVTGDPPAAALVERLHEARRQYAATDEIWFGIYRSIIDQLVHGPTPIPTLDADRAGFAITGFPYPEGTYQPASMIYLAEYDAGFYSYTWARVFGDDMFSAFEAGGTFSPDVGRRYRAEVLEPGWSRGGREKVERLLGRASTQDAFLRNIST